MKDLIEYPDFAKLDIRVGTITDAIRVEESEKLLKLTVDFGELGERTILTGMQKWYSPNDFINKQMLFVVNLAPKKMVGLESRGMLLSIGDNPPVFIHPSQPISNGTGVS
ncbi:MAG: methionine--tRNA ligase [Patescibacteria group bacterium]